MAQSKPGLMAKRGKLRIDPEIKREEDYWACRKAVRIRPVEEGDDMAVLKAYLTENLKIDSVSMSALGLDRAKLERVPYGPKSKVKKEMIVWFASVEARDVVKGAARNLSVLGPDYGVRLELPNHLKTAMQALQAASYEIKKKSPEAKRNVLFDDNTLDLVLDFSLGEGRPWRWMTAKQAKLAKRKRVASERDVKDSELDEILGRHSETDYEYGDE